jgi:methyltransferase (TIGR00027 family)
VAERHEYCQWRRSKLEKWTFIHYRRGMLDHASRTAAHVALFRALESARPRARLFDDPYAVRFLPGAYRLVARAARWPPAGRYIERYIDERWPGGPRASAIVRTRLIDDLVGDAVAAGATRVVLLGSGYDSRAYRLPALVGLPVFEIDHPATQRAKKRLVEARVPAERRTHVRFVPADLSRDELGAAGLDAGPCTVVVWEGVTNYLTADAVDTTLRTLAGTLGRGSRIVFTYVDRSALDGTGGYAGVDEWHAEVRRHGEPWTFGFEPEQLPAYLAERGLRLMLDLTARDAAARYLLPLGRDEPTAEFCPIAQAEVASAQGQ